MDSYALYALISLSILVVAALVARAVIPRVARRTAGPAARAGAAQPSPGAPPPPAPVPARPTDGDERLAAERADLDERSRRADRADRLRNLLISKMSHDIRTPLNSVLTLSQLLGEGTAGPLSFEQRKYVEIIHRNSRTLLALVGDILDLASLEAGRMELEAHPFDLRALVRGVADSCGPTAQQKGLPLHLNLPRRTVVVHTDEERLRHALVALVDHAIAETRNGYVELSVDAADGHAVAKVSDTGAGITAEARGALYDDFLLGSGPAGTTPPLPLIVAGRLVKLMGANVTVDSAAGEGTTFSISLPLGVDEGLTRPPPSNGVLTEAVSGRVLLIEDDDIERNRIGSILKGIGYDVTLAASGQEGLSLLRAGRYDAVVLDLVMPGMSGLDVLRSARNDERLGGTPFIVLSALYMTKSERAVLDPGVVAVVRKGETTAEELTTQLRRVIKAPGPRAERAPAPPPPAPAPAPGLGRRARVLVVEDNDDNLFTIKQVLGSLPVTIETASSGAEALEICRHHPPDLIMMDVELPGMSGLEASRAIHALPDRAGIPIIAITADVMKGDRERVLAGQCSDYLAKPVQPLDVVSAVTRALQLETH